MHLNSQNLELIERNKQLETLLTEQHKQIYMKTEIEKENEELLNRIAILKETQTTSAHLKAKLNQIVEENAELRRQLELHTRCNDQLKIKNVWHEKALLKYRRSEDNTLAKNHSFERLNYDNETLLARINDLETEQVMLKRRTQDKEEKLEEIHEKLVEKLLEAVVEENPDVRIEKQDGKYLFFKGDTCVVKIRETVDIDMDDLSSRHEHVSHCDILELLQSSSRDEGASFVRVSTRNFNEQIKGRKINFSDDLDSKRFGELAVDVGLTKVQLIGKKQESEGTRVSSRVFFKETRQENIFRVKLTVIQKRQKILSESEDEDEEEIARKNCNRNCTECRVF